MNNGLISYHIQGKFHTQCLHHTILWVQHLIHLIVRYSTITINFWKEVFFQYMAWIQLLFSSSSFLFVDTL